MAGSKGNAPFSIGSKPIMSTCPPTPYIKWDNIFTYYPSLTLCCVSSGHIQTRKSNHQYPFTSLLFKKINGAEHSIRS